MIMKKYGVKYNLQIPEVRHSIEETNLEKYGYKCVLQSPKVQEKIAVTNLKKYGAENVFMLEEFQEKGKQTKLERYGTTNTSQLEEIKTKTKETNLKKWGVENPAQSPIVQEKMKQTNLLRWDYEYTSQSPIVREKMYKTTMERFGVEVSFKSPIVREKTEKTMLERYGVINAMKSPEIKKKCAESLFKSGSIRTSKQQIYLNNLYNGILNKVIGYYNCDIVLDKEKIVIEYDGGGHDLRVILGRMTEKEFKQHEIIRSSVIKQNGFKTIRIISRKDYLPSDEVLLEILKQSQQYFKDYPNHSWREWDIDENEFRDAEHKDGELYDYGELRKIKESDVTIAS